MSSVYISRLPRRSIVNAWFYTDPSTFSKVRDWIQNQGYRSKVFGHPSLPLCNIHVEADVDLYKKLELGKSLQKTRVKKNDHLMSLKFPIEFFSQ